MATIEATIRAHPRYREIISMTDTHQVDAGLRHIAATEGLGVAVLVAWQQGISGGHIPSHADPNRPDAPGARVLAAGDGSPYLFVHVPVRQFRGDKPELARRGIMNMDADPAGLIYHEDGLVCGLSFTDPGSVGLTGPDITRILAGLAEQGLLVPADLDSGRIRFRDLTAARRVAGCAAGRYVRVENRPLDRDGLRLPAHLDRPEVRDAVVAALRYRSACNYCSVAALNPREATIHSTHARTDGRSVNGYRTAGYLATVRDYQIGFTFAPVADPRDACHFLAWDFPELNGTALTMEPQAYSFSDLMRLVYVINRDIEEFRARTGADPLPAPISGVCNHWAGNSIYHQHYQFLRIPDLPLLHAAGVAVAGAGTATRTGTGTGTAPVARYGDVEVSRVPAPWPAPAYLIRSASPGVPDDLVRVAESLARHWRALGAGVDRSYGNGIEIGTHTQNIFVTSDGDRLAAVFIPRDRRRLNTTAAGNAVQKRNAGVLEMMGYVIVDDERDFDTIAAMPPLERRRLGDSWLCELSPDPLVIHAFETNLRAGLLQPPAHPAGQPSGRPAG